MTSERRFEQDLPALLDGLYLAGVPDYRHDLVRRTARVRQRPAWTFLTRWIPMDVASRRLVVAPPPVRAIALAILLLILAIVGLLIGVGSTTRLPAPFGPARNGAFAYTQDDAVYVRDAVDAPERVLIGGDGTKNGFAGFSPDGTKVLFTRNEAGVDHLWVAEADGRNQRRVLDRSMKDAYLAWAPDSRTIAVATSGSGSHALALAHADGSPALTIDTGAVIATDLGWRPPSGAQLLFRGLLPDGHVDLFLVNADGSDLHRLHLPSPLVFGSDWDVSGPTWSPSGDRIAVNQIEPIDGNPGGHYRVHVVRPDGTGDVALPGPTQTLVNEAWPIWSPDGQLIAVEHFIFGNPDWDWVAALPSDGSAQAHNLLPPGPGDPGGGLVKAWLPDGSRLVVRNDGSGKMWSIDPAGRDPQPINWTSLDLPDVRRLAP